MQVNLTVAQIFDGVHYPPGSLLDVPIDVGSRLVSSGLALAVWPGAALDRVSSNMPRSTFIAFGDSITDNGTDYTSNYRRFNAYGFWPWALRLMGQPFDVIGNAGIGGQVTAQLLNRIDEDVLVHKPGWVHLLIGTNDVYRDVPAERVKLNIRTLCSRLIDGGARVVLSTLWPRSDAPVTTARRAAHLAVNDWIREYAYQEAGVILVDAFSVLVNPSSTVAAERTNCLRDALHPTNLGAYLVGKEIARVLGPLVPNHIHLPSSFADTFDNNSLSSNVMGVAGFFQGSSAATAPITGSRAAGWNIQRHAGSPDCVGSQPARSDGVGNNQRLAITSYANGDAIRCLYTA